MAFSLELNHGLSGCHIRTAVNIALCHYFFYGLFVVCFVYTNDCYPHLYHVDHMFGGSGATLMGVIIIGSIFAHTSSCQPIRFIFGILIPLNVLLIAVSTYYYTIERWYDVEVTALVKSLREPLREDFPDYFWRTLVVLSCINSVVFLIYLPYVISFMCHKRKLYLFRSSTGNDELSPLSPFSMPSVPSSNKNATKSGK